MNNIKKNKSIKFLLAIFTMAFFVFAYSAQATIYNWIQTDWSESDDVVNYPDHADNRTGWAKYYSKSMDAISTSTSGQITIAAGTATTTSESVSDTSDTDFASGVTFTNATTTGSGASGSVVLTGRKITKIDAADHTTCALYEGGALKCWGRNPLGPFSSTIGSTYADKDKPTAISGFGVGSDISVGFGSSNSNDTYYEYGAHVCVTEVTGYVKCFGRGRLGNDGQYGPAGTTSDKPSDNTTLPPITVSNFTNAIDTDSAYDHSCSVLDDGTVECWGENYHYQLGDGTRNLDEDDVATSTQVTGISTAVEVGVGEFFSCARLSSGAVHCWGYGYLYCMGDGSTANNTTPGAVTGISTAAQLAVGLEHACARLSNGTVQCWGSGGNGKLGDGSTTDNTTPNAVTGISTATYIATDRYHTCAVLSNGTVQCWGLNDYGQLGDGTTTQRSAPVTAVGISTAIAVAVGSHHTCALLADGSAKCWGYNLHGQLGNQDDYTEITSVAVSGLTDVSDLQASDLGRFVCALISDGSIKCWGLNEQGQFGNGGTVASQTPVTSSITGASQIAVGGYHVCAIIGTEVKCWGDNLYGQLGNGNNTDSTTGVTVTGVTSPSGIIAGGYHTCAYFWDGSVKCWGRGNYGQLGNGANSNSNTAVNVSSMSVATGLAAGSHHTCALTSSGTAKCWGLNNKGQLGDDSTTNRNTPVEVDTVQGASFTALTGISEISGGNETTCARLGSGQARCWGWGQLGQRGDGWNRDPVIWDDIWDTTRIVSGVSTAIDIDLSIENGCVVNGSGTVTCWGYNYYGQVGDGNTTAAYTPVSVFGITTATKVVNSKDFSCALLSNGTVRCWGYKEYLGNTVTSSISYSSPQTVYNSEYTTSGTFISQIFDTTSNDFFGTISISSTTPANTSLSIKVRTGTTSDMLSAAVWIDCPLVSSGDDISGNACVTDGHRYLQYQIDLDSDTYNATPEIDSVTVYHSQNLVYDLVFSPFNTSNEVNRVTDLSWTDVASGTVKFQMRTATTSGAVPGTWSDWYGASGVDSYYENSASSSIDATQADGSGEQWLQLKAVFTPQTEADVVLSNVVTSYGWCDTLTGALTYNPFSTCGAASCDTGYTLTGSGSSGICCSNMNGALTYNSSCGAATCDTGYTQSGSGADGACCADISGALTYNSSCGAATCGAGQTVSGSGASAICVCSTLTGAATYNALPTCGAATCNTGYTLIGSGSSGTCCSNISSALTYNSSCGAATCDTGYALSGSGASATCSRTSTSSGGGGGGGGGAKDETAPRQPTEFTATRQAGKIVLTWKNPTDLDFFRVVVSRSDEEISNAITGLALKDFAVVLLKEKFETVTDSTINPGATYYYAISAYDQLQNYSKPLIIKMGPNDTRVVYAPPVAAIKTEYATSVAGYTIEQIEKMTSLGGIPKEVVEYITKNESNLIHNYKHYTALTGIEKTIFEKLATPEYRQKYTATGSTTLEYFILSGTPTTRSLGAGERAGAVNSFRAAFGRLPDSQEDWSDVIKIGNGRWPSKVSIEAEAKVKAIFKKIYLREPNMSQPNDNAAISVMAYGLRPAKRSTNSEAVAIKTFKGIFKYHPASATDWDVVRAIAYSGAVR